VQLRLVFKNSGGTSLIPGGKVKRLVLYLGYDWKSTKIKNTVELYKDLFDEVRIIHVPESDPDVLDGLSIPSVAVEEYSV
jgi:hypothetical protein